jgi:H+-translocating NAD(P) transhydrogenase subunit alpha
MKIGILKESGEENRVALLPDSASFLVSLKVSVLAEKRAGTSAFSSDKEYQAAGALVSSRDKVISDSDLLVMIHPPEKKDLQKLKEGQVLTAVLNPYMNKELIETLAAQNITSFSMDVIPRTSRAQAMDILSSQATVAGYKAVIDAAGKFSGFMPMLMTAAGTVKPAKVLILGAGVAGLQAVATARKLGAVVEVFDVRTAVKEEVMSLGAKFVEVEGAIDDSKAGGYAVEQTKEFKEKQQQVIQEHAAKSDIIICTAQIPGKKAPLLIVKDTVEKMEAGSVIIDLAASTGGNCELTKNNEVIVHKQVTIVGNSNYPSEMPADASLMFGKNIINFLKLIIDEEGNMNLNFEDDIVQGTCVTHNKEIVNQAIKEFFNKQ